MRNKTVKEWPKKIVSKARHWYLILVILTIWEAEIERITFQD
jgi:hypothetical protein